MKAMMFITKSLLLFTKVVVMVANRRDTDCEQAVPTQLRCNWIRVKFSAFIKDIAGEWNGYTILGSYPSDTRFDS